MTSNVNTLYNVQCTVHRYFSKSCDLPETINIQVTSNTTYMNGNFEQTKNLIWLYICERAAVFCVCSVAVDGARITISSFTVKNRNGKHWREKKFVHIHLATIFPHSFHFTEYFCPMVCCCCYHRCCDLLAIYRSSTQWNVYEVRIVWNILYAFIQANGKHILFMDSGIQTSFSSYSGAQRFFMVITECTRVSGEREQWSKTLFQIVFSSPPCFYFSFCRFSHWKLFAELQLKTIWVSCFPIICTTKFILIAFSIDEFSDGKCTRVEGAKWVKWWLNKVSTKIYIELQLAQQQHHRSTWPSGVHCFFLKYEYSIA